MTYNETEYRLKDNGICVLRSASLEDAREMIDYLRVTNEESYFMLRYPEEITMTEDEEKELLKEWVENPNKLLLLAVIDGHIIGSCGIAPIAGHLKTKHRASFGISVKKAHWGKGVGKLLMTEVLAFAKTCGFEQVELGVFSDNTRARKLYEQFGFAEWGRILNAYKLKDGTYRDEISMGILCAQHP